MSDLTLRQIENEVAKLDTELDRDDPDFKRAVLLLSAIQVGTTVTKLRAFTKYPYALVSTVVRRAKQNGIFQQDGTIACEWFAKDHGGIALWMDVCVVAGLMNRGRSR